MITRQYTSFEVVNARFMWISRMFIGFSFSENLGEFRIRGSLRLFLNRVSVCAVQTFRVEQTCRVDQLC